MRKETYSWQDPGKLHWTNSHLDDAGKIFLFLKKNGNQRIITDSFTDFSSEITLFSP